MKLGSDDLLDNIYEEHWDEWVKFINSIGFMFVDDYDDQHYIKEKE